jgi:transketolase C-terminal domain/subunit
MTGHGIKGSTAKMHKCRDAFGKIICDVLADTMDIRSKVLVVDSDLEGSCGLHHIRKKYPEIYIHGGIMERNNFSTAAGFGSALGPQGIFATFSAFLEMVILETTMARLNQSNVLAHFSHTGVDETMLSMLGNSKFVLVVETQNIKTGLGARFGTWLLERGYAPQYAHMGVSKEGQGGLGEQIVYQKMDSTSICKRILRLIAASSIPIR